MILYLYDTEPDPLAAEVGDINLDSQAAKEVLDTGALDAVDRAGRWFVRWELVDDEGLRAKWERPVGDDGHPTLTFRAGRYTGA